MAFFDLPLDQLRAYKPERIEPKDFDAFWKSTLEETRKHHLNATFTPVEFGLQTVETFDVTFAGFGGQPVKGWLVLPRQRAAKIPAVVEFIGYGGGRGFPTDWLVWSAAGYAHLVMDTRGQGSTWGKGDTPDPEPEGSNPAFPGSMTKGILDPATYYYRRLFADAVRAVEAALVHPAVDGQKIAVAGGSQGGGISIAAAGLLPGVVTAALPDVPFLCHHKRAVSITDANPYQEIAKYLVVHRDKESQVWKTLSYFDGVNFAARAKANALFSVGLMDEICPPSTVYAAYNHWLGKKDMRVWTYNHHEGGGQFQTVEKVRYLRALFG